MSALPHGDGYRWIFDHNGWTCIGVIEPHVCAGKGRDGLSPGALVRLDVLLDSRDAANELADGTLPYPSYAPLVAPPPPLKHSHDRRRKAPAHFWDAPKIAQAFQAWVVEHGEVPKAIDWNPTLALARGRPDVAERFRAGVWPTAVVVAERCGSWNAGLERAGLAVRPPYRVAA